MRFDKRRRIAVIDYDLCDPEGCGGYVCERVCPVNRMGRECIVHEGKEKPRIIEDACTGCMLCPPACPFHAITIVNLTVDPGEPLHQYGENAFRLYRMVSARDKTVTGLLGPNGCGKTTIVRILAGQLTPNLGDFSQKGDWEKVLARFAGREVQDYFKKVSAGGLKLALKPQAVDEIPKRFPGKLRALLEKADASGRLEAVAREMRLGHVLERKTGQLSGGELQRAAIAATLLKDADVYFFDEPTSYLDVRERLRVAETISALGEEKTVVVVEHDLAVLDYLCAYVHLFFGTPGAYGVVSHVKKVRTGINEYLAGYLPDENLRFRASELSFGVKPPAPESRAHAVVAYPALEKRLGEFSLQMDAGEVREAEVLGIVGPNAIGKTTFVKLLAGVEAPDAGEVDKKLRVSYKPQYVSAPKGKTVSDLFADQRAQESPFFDEVRRRLSLLPLWEKRAHKLSGGELQRVAVALALLREADLFLLDEPSAFLDVEQRLQAAHAIKSVVSNRKKAAFVVDHDILFQDYVSDRMLVFDGEPGKRGHGLAPLEMRAGMNAFLKNLGITMRRDPQTGRPRVNQGGSVRDREQKKSGEHYYVR